MSRISGDSVEWLENLWIDGAGSIDIDLKIDGCCTWRFTEE
jgi:hypothetical protein